MLLFWSRIFTCLTLNRPWHFCQGIGHTTAILKGDGSILAAFTLPPFQAFPAMQAGHRDRVQEGQTLRNTIRSPRSQKGKIQRGEKAKEEQKRLGKAQQEEARMSRACRRVCTASEEKCLMSDKAGNPTGGGTGDATLRNLPITGLGVTVPLSEDTECQTLARGV